MDLSPGHRRTGLRSLGSRGSRSFVIYTAPTSPGFVYSGLSLFVFCLLCAAQVGKGLQSLSVDWVLPYAAASPSPRLYSPATDLTGDAETDIVWVSFPECQVQLLCGRLEFEFLTSF